MLRNLLLVFICEWADKKDMWRHVDANSDGHLNYFEFCAAFQVEDKKNELECVKVVRRLMQGFLLGRRHIGIGRR